MDRLTKHIVELIVAGKANELAELYAPEALVDINVPQWRFQLLGADVKPRLRDEFEVAERRMTWHRATYLDGGVVVETETRFLEDGEERLWRDVILFRTDGERIVES